MCDESVLLMIVFLAIFYVPTGIGLALAYRKNNAEIRKVQRETL